MYVYVYISIYIYSHLWHWAPFPELRLCLGDRHLSHSAEGQGEIQTLHWSSQPMEVVEGP